MQIRHFFPRVVIAIKFEPFGAYDLAILLIIAILITPKAKMQNGELMQIENFLKKLKKKSSNLKNLLDNENIT